MTYSERFSKFMPWLIEHEGTVYENDPDDPGGATKFGIDQRSHPKEDIRNITLARATEIYWLEYWQKGGSEAVPFPLGEIEFNCNVNAGFGRTAKILASIAPDTAENFLKEQEGFYRRLVAARPKSQKYLKGWLNRLHDLRETLHMHIA